MIDHSVPNDKLVVTKVRDLVVGDVVRDFYVADPTFGVVVARVHLGFRTEWDDGTVTTMRRKGGYSIIRALRSNEFIDRLGRVCVREEES